ncbi:MAG: hypothetical protein J0M04_05875 [Verrucomicrobia bacterium]|nr:hypothetical protein [Verrucomicrobiota bacterium]
MPRDNHPSLSVTVNGGSRASPTHMSFAKFFVLLNALRLLAYPSKDE